MSAIIFHRYLARESLWRNEGMVCKKNQNIKAQKMGDIF